MTPCEFPSCSNSATREAETSCERGHDRRLLLCSTCLEYVALGEYWCPTCRIRGNPYVIVFLNDSHALPTRKDHQQ